MIRHAAAAAFPVVPLPVAVIEPPLLALLVTPVGVPPLLTALFLSASHAAVPVAPVTMTTDPEHHATAGAKANPAAAGAPRGSPSPPYRREGTAASRHGNLDPIYRWRWAVFSGRYEKTRSPANGQGFPLPPAAPPCQSLGKPHR